MPLPRVSRRGPEMRMSRSTELRAGDGLPDRTTTITTQCHQQPVKPASNPSEKYPVGGRSKLTGGTALNNFSPCRIVAVIMATAIYDTQALAFTDLPLVVTLEHIILWKRELVVLVGRRRRPFKNTFELGLFGAAAPHLVPKRSVI